MELIEFMNKVKEIADTHNEEFFSAHTHLHSYYSKQENELLYDAYIAGLGWVTNCKSPEDALNGLKEKQYLPASKI